jgi:glycosyltransferase involved in cell wall biosynthesis
MQRSKGVDFRFAIKLAKYVSEKNIGIIHAYNDTAIFYAALAIRIGKVPIPLIGTFGTRPTYATTGARLLTRWASGRATQIVAKSHELSDWLVTEKWVNRSITISNGVDLARFCPNGGTGEWRERLQIPDHAILVGHVGRFDPIKRHADMLEAAAVLESRQLPIFFAFAGYGASFHEFQALSSRLKNVRLLSNVEDVPSFLRSLDIFILCSAHEGCPLALLEAMACGRPIIATQVGGIPYLLAAREGTPAGILIPPFRADLLTQQIRLLAFDQELRFRLGTRAQIRAQTFSFEQEWRQYSALYSSGVPV